MIPLLEIEEGLWQQGINFIAGVDEAGRGPLAGPVVAAACILPQGKVFPGVQDSKTLSEKKRENLYDVLTSDEEVFWAVSVVDEKTIDSINILQATLVAMRNALLTLKRLPEYVLVDGRDMPSIEYAGESVIRGDSLSQSIAAASIIAKCYRDLLMKEYATMYPQYGFEKHKGYGTELHREAIKKYGPCPLHRRTFIRNIV